MYKTWASVSAQIFFISRALIGGSLAALAAVFLVGTTKIFQAPPCSGSSTRWLHKHSTPHPHIFPSTSTCTQLPFFYQWNLTCLPLFFYEPPPLLRYHYYPPAQFTTAGQQEAAVGGGVHCVWMVQIGYCARWKVEDKPEPSSGLFRLIGSAGYLIWT